MDTNNQKPLTATENSAKKSGRKIAIIASIALLLLIPLMMVQGLIDNREETNEKARREVSSSYAGTQTITAPTIHAKVERDSVCKTYKIESAAIDYRADVKTDVLHRSIYDIIVYNSTIDITGTIEVNDNLLNSHENTLCFFISDFKGLYRIPDVEIEEKRYQLQKKSDSYNDYFQTTFDIPADCKLGDTIRYALTLNIKGTEELTFKASGKETTLVICSPYPHPSFKGDFLPESREVGEAGFSATWRVLGINTNGNSGYMGVRFVDPVNSYQQSMRSAKYGIIIIIMVFIAGLLVELLTKRGIHPIQYAIIGVSLVLFYSLLLSFSEFIPFGISYALAAAMTISALTLYFKAILKHKSAYVLGAFVTLVYIINYMLLQMETYALIAGSMTLFVMLCVMMYLTTGINNKN